MKHSKKYLPVYIAFLAIFALSCARKLITDDYSPRETSLIIWAHADIQPYNLDEKDQYEIAMKDIRNMPFVPDMAIIAGDLVHKRDSQQYWDWMNILRSESGIPVWFEIAGNHDQNNPAAYLENSGKPWHYAVRSGNILFIFLSDEVRSAVTDISDGVFEWWKDLVINNQDLIIVTITHAALKQSRLLSTLNSTMCIKDSERFWEVIKKYRVDLWISAHTHLPNYLPIKTSTRRKSGTFFLDISSIHKHIASPIESWILIFKDGSRSLLCLSRNHEKGKFYGTSFKLNLPMPFIYGSGKPLIVSQYQ